MENIKRIKLKKVSNTRDLGGFVNKAGRRIASNRLIRSGTLFGLEEDDIRILREEHGLKRIVDFRTVTERQESPDPEIPGVDVIHNPILNESMMGITRESGSVLELLKAGSPVAEGYMEKLYVNLINEDFCLKAYARFFEILLEAETGATLWHCSAGKDRVGVGTALLLTALEVPQETVMKDYLMTGTFLAKEVELIVAKVAGVVPDMKVLEGFKRMLLVEEAYLESVFSTIAEEYGTVEVFMDRKLGLSKERRLKLQELYLEP